MDPDIEAILAAGNSAPSGENSQPWHFALCGGRIEVRVLPERDQSAYGWGARASYLAVGAVIENMALAASARGYRADITMLPEGSDPYLAARIELAKDSSVAVDPLATFIGKRVTNRKRYEKHPLTEPELEALRRSVPLPLSIRTHRPDIDALARIGALNEEIMLGNDGLHDFFFSHVNWTKEEDDAKKIGFYIKTLELPPPARLVFSLMRYPILMKALRAVGTPAVVGRQNAATYASSSAICAVSIADDSPRDFLSAGRAAERLWLTATSLKLSLQPMTGILFFELALAHGDQRGFSPAEAARIRTAYRRAQEIFETRDTIAFICRVGEGAPPSAQAARFPLREVVDAH